jgi:UDP-glucose:(heptosyl)LPS alpha-1,3-glucosyltransferase
VTRPRIAIVSPFVDKRHGTERCLAEQIERLKRDFEIHLFSSHVEDTDLAGVEWHRVPEIPGPHLVKYLFWFAANPVWRWRERRRSGRSFDFVFSPGVNCLDADVILVHIVFDEFFRSMGPEWRLSQKPLRFWPRLIHRQLYYRLLVALERRIYRRSGVVLAAISRKTAEDVERLRGAKDSVAVVYYGIDAQQFNPERRNVLRRAAREQLGVPPEAFAILLVGNDWKKKGLDCLLRAIGILNRREIHLLICGVDDRAPYERQFAALGGRVHFLPLRNDVEFYYSAADVLAAPSLEDAFSLPPLEAMGSGLPVVVSGKAGVSEVVTHGEDGLILEGPTDAEELARTLHLLLDDEPLRLRMAECGVKSARKFTWDANASQMKRIFDRLVTGERSQQGNRETCG